MKYLLTLLLLLGAAFGQNVRYDNIAYGPKGPVPFALVAVCTQPAVTTTTPCSPLANLCSSLTDTTCTSPNPVTTDSLGNFHFYTKSSTIPFTVQVYGTNVIAPYVLTDQGTLNTTTALNLAALVCCTESVVAVQGTASPSAWGPFASNGLLTLSNSAINIQNTATEGVAVTYSSAATASTNTVIGVKIAENGNNSLGPVVAFYQASFKLAVSPLTNARYWIGLGTWVNSGGTGNDGALIFGTSAYAQDTPNKNTIAFRYSAGTDVHWQAVVTTATSGSGNRTVVDTGITPDTNIHLYQIVPNSTGTAITFYIDNSQVATISTNIPALGGNDSLMTQFWVGDNKNTATVVSGSFYWMLWATI